LGGCQRMLFLCQQCFWTILWAFQIFFYASTTVFLFSITLYSQFLDVLNWLRNFYKAFCIKFKITLHSCFYINFINLLMGWYIDV
jgi:hypothetical protein